MNLDTALREMVTSFKPKMDGQGHVIQASEKQSPQSDPEHAGEEATLSPSLPTEPPRS